ncbi:TIGR01777 family oxidoreductase [Bacillus solitudinis]|uniref:TIGR01777 family oxidoreductase n=1 Tax=Bacillus solitudinis TaxID=2014074 RepID=UPI000C23E6D2|nr:TIGR01777 family oxidoreductase [Bacillus solitudinis]
MKIAIAGGSGFIGNKLTKRLISLGHSLIILTRTAENKPPLPNTRYVEWLHNKSNPSSHLENIDAIINLAGESIGRQRWTNDRKASILNSRIQTTEELIDIISKLGKKPELLINASAIGYYGNSLTKTFTEDSLPVDKGFLADVVRRWETKASLAQSFGVRTVFCRLGVVLDKNEGALTKMLLPYKLFAGGTMGSGKQWISWIHIDDVIELFILAIEQHHIKGPLNLTSPNPLQMKEFGQTISSVLNRPHWLPAPSFALKIALGEMSTLVLDGQKVLPKKAILQGYQFKYPELTTALENTVKNP